MKRKDLYLAAAVLTAAVLMWAFLSISRNQTGNTVRITVNGSLYGEYSLDDDQTIEIETELGRNVLIIENGGIYMNEADCPDGYCIKQGKVQNNTQTIVCLPHKLVAEVFSKETGGSSNPDTVTR